MANGYFERGEIYWVKMGTGVGVEMNVTRPGLIVSCNKFNTTSDGAIVVFLTTKDHRGTWCGGNTFATGRESWVMCNQIQMVDKTRFTKYLGTVTPSEMRSVEDTLEDLFDLGYENTEALAAKDREIADRDLLVAEARDETAGVRAELEKRNEEIAALTMEIGMWQNCYRRCMDMLVDMKVNADLSRRTAVVEPVVEGKATRMIPDLKPETPVEPPKVEEQPQDDRLDINSCTATALKKIGFSLAMARKIVESRPFKSVEDLKRVNGLKSNLYRVMEPKLCCVAVTVEEPVVAPVVEPEVKKVNVNTATVQEFMEIAGLSKTNAYLINSYRKKNPPFTCVDDLLKIPRIYPGTLAKCREFLEV